MITESRIYTLTDKEIGTALFVALVEQHPELLDENYTTDGALIALENGQLAFAVVAYGPAPTTCDCDECAGCDAEYDAEYYDDEVAAEEEVPTPVAPVEEAPAPAVVEEAPAEVPTEVAPEAPAPAVVEETLPAVVEAAPAVVDAVPAVVEEAPAPVVDEAAPTAEADKVEGDVF